MTFIALVITAGCSVAFLCLAVWGCLILFKNLRFARRAAVADGVVVSVRKKTTQRFDRDTKSMQTSTSSYPTVSFGTPDGQRHAFTSEVSSSHKRRDKVRVLYDPLDADDAMIGSFVMLYGRPLGGIALASAMCGVFIYFCVLLVGG